MSTITLYRREGCTLCDHAEVLIADIAPDRELVRVDVDRDPALRDRYGVRVPVVVVDGLEVAELVVDEAALRLVLQGRR